MEILIAIIGTFCATATWQLLATRKNKANQRLMLSSLINELDQMAIKLGYKDFISYLEATKGRQYATVAMENLISFRASFTDKGPG